MTTKTIKSYAVLSVSLAVVVIAQAQNNQRREGLSDPISVGEIRDYRKMSRVNKEPVDMIEATKLMCAPASTVLGPHYDPGVVYYINDLAREGLATFTKTRLFPVGSIIVKEKQERRTEDSVQIITVMKKVRPGNSEDSWEYKMYDAKTWKEPEPARQLVSLARKTCLDCHRRYQGNDYVSDKGIGLLLGKQP